MKGIHRIFRLALLKPRDVGRDVDEEISLHLAMREERLRAHGLAPDEASRLARDRFGDIDRIREACLREGHPAAHRARVRQFVDELRLDTHFAVRSLWRAKGFAAAVIVTLALGIGANSAVFSITSAIVLRPVQGVADADQVFELRQTTSYPAFRDLRDRLVALHFAGIRERRMALGRDGTAAEQRAGAIVSGNFFATLGVRAELGRTLNDSDDIGGAPVVSVLAFDYWVRAFGGDSSAIGRLLVVNGASTQIVGVAARDFRGLHLGSPPSVFVPIHSWPQIAPPSTKPLDIESRSWEWVSVVGRLAPGMTLPQARTGVAAALSDISPEASRDDIEDASRPRPLQSAALPAGARNAAVQFSAILAGVVALVLLAACANIAGLLLSRASQREREIAVRIALGAGRGRLVRQLLTEALVLSGLGGLAGIAVFLASRAALAGVTLPGGVDAGTLRTGLDVPLLGFTLAVTLLTGLIVGLAPALHAARADTNASMKGGGGARRPARQLLRGSLVTAQVAVGLSLLVASGLFARALGRALAVDLGFGTDRLLMMTVEPGLAQMNLARATPYYATVASRVRAVPGVSDVTWSGSQPLSNDEDREQAKIPGYEPPPGQRVQIETGVVGARYHETMGIRLLAGRGFDERDTRDAPPVTIVNETLAKRYYAGRTPVGTYLELGDVHLLVVGVSSDAKYHDLSEEPRPYAYRALMQAPNNGGAGAPTLIVRTGGTAAPLLQSVLAIVRAIEPAVPVYDATTLGDRLRLMLAPQRAGAWLLGIFSLLALVVAAVGIYGIVAFSVSQRTREIGVRMALGASRGNVVRLVVRRSVFFVSIGVPIGLALAIFMGRAMAGFLYGIGSMDPPTLLGTSVLMLAVGIAASWLPARRAVRIDPQAALRAEN